MMDDEFDPLTEEEARESLAIWRERDWRIAQHVAKLKLSIRRKPNFVKRVNLMYATVHAYYIDYRLEDAKKRVK